MSKTKILIASVIALAIINIITLSVVWLQAKPHFPRHNFGMHQQPPHKKGFDHMDHFISNKLGFNDTQKKQFKELKRAHFEQIEKHHKQKRELMKELFQLLKADEVNNSKKASLIAKSTALEQQMISTKFEHFQALKKLCTSDQLDAFLEMIERMENRMPHERGLRNHPAL